MKLWKSLHHIIGAGDAASIEDVEAYRHVGGQVLDVVQKLSVPGTPPAATAYSYVARGLELVADGLLEPYIEGENPPPMPDWVKAQAVSLYRPIPELVTAAKQEAIDPDGERDVDLPWVLKGRVLRSERDDWRSLEAYGGGVKALMEWTDVTVSGSTPEKTAALYFAEATTNFDSASHLLYGFSGQTPSFGVRHSLDDYLWKAIAYALGALQEQCVPGIFEGLDIDTVLEGVGVEEGHLQVMSFDRSGHTEAVRDIASSWYRAMQEHPGPYARDPHHPRRD
jgi:hypothetical protein